MRLSDHALFNLGEAEISVAAIPILKKIGSIVAKTDYLVRIEGHTDDLPIRTVAFPSNWELSTARAVNVLRYLTEKFSLSPQRISAVGFGEYQTVAPNDSPANRAKNRRVEIIFSKPEKAEKPLGPSDEENQK
jgi:chemotaxis protein MotB